jgi:ribosomal protein S18 acetylase RimI-like enzyme
VQVIHESVTEVIFAAIYGEMDHILDNPIYNALNSGNQQFSIGNENSKFFQPGIAPFAGLKTNSDNDFSALDRISPPESTFVIFTPERVSLPGPWKGIREMELLQMVYEGTMPPHTINQDMIDLNAQHVPEMLALTQLTNPGPFLNQTIQFGNYTGIISDGRLVAMAGQRQQPLPYIEVSAVCTHPDHLGKGYASLLITEQIKRIIMAGAIPFLHVLAGNQSAISVYERLGFKTRKQLVAYVFQKERR